MKTGLNVVSGKEAALMECLSVMSRIFWGPDPETCAEWKKGSPFPWSDELTSILDNRFRDAVEGLQHCIGAPPDGTALYEELETAYVRLFVNSRDGITAPLSQSCYEGENGVVMGEAAVAMKKRLASAGLSLGEGLGEPPDHVSIQLEYLYFLLDKGLMEGARGVLAEASSFAANVLSPWISVFCRRLGAGRDKGFYSFSALALCSVLEFVSGLIPHAKERRWKRGLSSGVRQRSKFRPVFRIAT